MCACVRACVRVVVGGGGGGGWAWWGGVRGGEGMGDGWDHVWLCGLTGQQAGGVCVRDGALGGQGPARMCRQCVVCTGPVWCASGALRRGGAGKQRHG